MRRLFVVIAILFSATMIASAKSGFGVTAGLNYNSTKIRDIKTDPRAGFNVGVTYSLDLPLGFSLQPSVLYTQQNGGVVISGSGILDKLVSGSIYQTVGSVVVPVSLQWGPNLIIARPFLDVTPYVGYALSNKLKSVSTYLDGSVIGNLGLDYGVGIGAGINVWKLQAIVRYNWNFGTMGSLKDFADIDISNLGVGNQTFGGISVNVAYFF